jgi:hypothetical protein
VSSSGNNDAPSNDAPSIDVARLPGPAQKILDPSGPPPLKAMAAKGVVPGLKPGDVLAVLVVLAQAEDANGQTARKTLESLPGPVLNGALGQADVQPGALDAIASTYADKPEVAEKILNHPQIHPGTVVRLAQLANELVCELIATNEERLLGTPAIIERLYMNKACRMSTADRLLELAVRNQIELAIPAFAQAKAAIQGELIIEATEEPSFDDVQFAEASEKAAEIELAEGEDIAHIDDETGEETVTEKAKPLHAIWTEMRPPAKIRLLTIGTLKTYDKAGKVVDEQRFDIKALRALGVRDANPLVALASLETPGINEGEIERIAKMRNVCEDVLRAIAMKPDWTRHYTIKKNLVMNPRTPFGQAAKFVLHLYENDLKAITKSRDVSGAVQTAARQQLQRKGKKG